MPAPQDDDGVEIERRVVEAVPPKWSSLSASNVQTTGPGVIVQARAGGLGLR
jgi:hypothetical protein